jgi:putative intracellular protease/amidase
MVLPRHIKVGVVVFEDAFPTDFVGPLDILNTLKPESDASKAKDVSISSTILASSLDPLRLWGGMKVVADQTLQDAAAEEWDAVLVPGGRGARPWLESNSAAQDFLKAVVPRTKVVLTGESLAPAFSGP